MVINSNMKNYYLWCPICKTFRENPHPTREEMRLLYKAKSDTHVKAKICKSCFKNVQKEKDL